MMQTNAEDGSLKTGDRVEKYVIEGVLGEGGMARVYRVRHVTLDTTHALKVLTHHQASVRARLLLEGRTQAQLRHANIVAVTDVIELQTGVGLVLEYVAGAALDELLARKTLSLDQVDQLAEGIFRGVLHAHEQGLVHRDLKPANILLQLEGRRVVPKVADFGLVKSVGGIGTTRTGVAMGTPRYMAPEQIRDAKSVDARADVFALGAILYELVTGQAAFSPGVDDILEIFNAIADSRYTPAKALRPELPQRMSNAIDAALCADVEERLHSVAALRTMWFGAEAKDDLGWELDLATSSADSPTAYPPDLGSVLATLAPTPSPVARVFDPPPLTGVATSPSSETALPRPSRRRWGVALAGMLLALLVLLGGVSGGLYAAWSWYGAPPPTVVVASPPPAPPVEVPAPLETTAPSETPAPTEPTPVEPAVEPTVEASPRAAPRPAPTRPHPLPSPATPAPATPAPPAPSIEAAPAPAAVPTPELPAPVEVAPSRPTSFQISGARGYLRAGGVDHGPGPIPPGTYTVLATFDDLPVTVQSDLRVTEGQQVHVKCTASFRLCKVEVSP